MKQEIEDYQNGMIQSHYHDVNHIDTALSTLSVSDVVDNSSSLITTVPTTVSTTVSSSSSSTGTSLPVVKINNVPDIEDMTVGMCMNTACSANVNRMCLFSELDLFEDEDDYFDEYEEEEEEEEEETETEIGERKAKGMEEETEANSSTSSSGLPSLSSLTLLTNTSTKSNVVPVPPPPTLFDDVDPSALDLDDIAAPLVDGDCLTAVTASSNHVVNHTVATTNQVGTTSSLPRTLSLSQLDEFLLS